MMYLGSVNPLSGIRKQVTKETEEDPIIVKLLAENQAREHSLGIQFENTPTEASILHFHKHFLSSPEKKSIILLQFQALKERATFESRNVHPDRGKFLDRLTFEAFKALCDKFGASHIIRLRSLEIYDRFMSVYNSQIASSVCNYNKEDVEKITKRIETQTLLRICSCIQLAYKFHYDHDNMCIGIYKIQSILKANSLTYSPKAIKRSEQRVYKTIDYTLHFVTPLDIIEHIIQLMNIPMEHTKMIYHLCIQILDYTYTSHAEIYQKIKEKKISICSLETDGYCSVEFDLIFRGAAILACAFFFCWPNSHDEKAQRIADICSLPEQSILDFSTLLVDELIVK